MFNLNNWLEKTNAKLKELVAWAASWKPAINTSQEEAVFLHIEKQGRHGNVLKSLVFNNQFIYGGIEYKTKSESDFSVVYLTYAHSIDISSFPDDVASYSSILAKKYIIMKERYLRKLKDSYEDSKFIFNSCVDIKAEAEKIHYITCYNGFPNFETFYWPSELVVEQKSGLNRIHQSIDTQQDDAIRKRITGITIITGIPGSGKTSIAIMRIQLIVDRQFYNEELDPKDAAILKGYNISKEKPIFKPDKMMVFIRANHLKNYLSDFCGEHLFPTVKVFDFNDWMLATVRQYIIELARINKSDPPVFTKNKIPDIETSIIAVFNEIDLKEVLEEQFSDCFIHQVQRSVEDVKNVLTPLFELINSQKIWSTQNEGIQLTILLNTLIEEMSANKMDEGYRMQTIEAWKERTNDAYQKIVEYFRLATRSLNSFKFILAPESISELWLGSKGETISQRKRGITDKIQDILRNTTDRWISKDLNPLLILAAYYSSDKFNQLLNNNNIILSQPAKEFFNFRKKYHEIHSAELPIVLWIQLLITKDYRSLDESRISRIHEYDHIVLDEAQLYPEYLIRAIISLAKKPFTSVTLSGDIEQSDATSSGIKSWDNIIKYYPPEIVSKPYHLNVGYRWSKQIFAFLEKALKILMIKYKYPLELPVMIKLKDGPKVQVLRFNKDDIIEKFIKEISVIYDNIDWANRPEKFCIIFPSQKNWEHSKQILNIIINKLESFGINALLMEGESFQINFQGLIILQADDAIGFQFDHVIIAYPEMFFLDETDVLGIKTLWTAMTRPCVSLTLVGVYNENKLINEIAAIEEL